MSNNLNNHLVKYITSNIDSKDMLRQTSRNPLRFSTLSYSLFCEELYNKLNPDLEKNNNFNKLLSEYVFEYGNEPLKLTAELTHRCYNKLFLQFKNNKDLSLEDKANTFRNLNLYILLNVDKQQEAACRKVMLIELCKMHQVTKDPQEEEFLLLAISKLKFREHYTNFYDPTTKTLTNKPNPSAKKRSSDESIQTDKQVNITDCVTTDRKLLKAKRSSGTNLTHCSTPTRTLNSSFIY